MSRTKKSIRNIAYNIVNVLLTLVLMFGVRTVFIQTLGVEYLGLNGVFQNIFQFLSLAELGIGSAIAFRLYQPLNEGNERRISALMKFFKLAYRVISIFIIVMALGLLPFLGRIIGDQAEGINIYLVFAMYIAQTLSTYLFFAYKTTLLQADQREYIISKYANYVIIGTSISEVAVLYFFQSFYGYLLILVVSNITKNYLISRRVDKDYPYIQKYDDKIGKAELKEMLKDFSAAFLYRINSVVLSSTDNLVLTYFVGLATVGYYSNYTLLANSIKRFLRPILNSVKASLGSFVAQKSKEESYRIFQVVNLMTTILYGGASIGIFILSNKFITVWIGDQFTLSTAFVLLFAFEFYLRGMTLFLSQIRNAMGLFQQLKYRPLLSMIINLVTSIVLVQILGIEGVILGTITATMLTTMIFDPLVIHSYGFNFKTSTYFIKNAYYVFLMGLAGYIAYVLTLPIALTIPGLFYSFLLTVVSIIIVYGLGLFWMKEWQELIPRIRTVIKKKK
ncbi:O-antigen flippase Wzx [Alkalibacterium sp. AK22]|uniref:lipopolysaccharide biosynthesis protein n=1 Tax=Alkalibacterium sp. AK22 TaxID=1229520 RepID=UPI0004497EEC|nr:lipopolysaccharide biosynthesis protein [Alkalibacterium sp. AK22]EXJ23331.1 O-antigen flippase Wzx [Alkalibacterium sp. AK22]